MTFGPQGSWDSQIKEAKMKKSDLINRIGERFLSCLTGMLPHP